MSRAIPVVFAGPSLTGQSPSDMDLRPPAAAGDLLVLTRGPPRIVVLIDGMFDVCAAVQHKEVLELLFLGFPVLGGASMGALRAAELQRYGMIGIGAVFNAYATAMIEGDDEVALLHAPGSFGYVPFTVPLVDVRATLVSAVQSRVIDAIDARSIRQYACVCFWRDRTWTAIIDACHSVVDARVLVRFERWLDHGFVSIKARDAARCVAAARSLSLTGPFGAPPPRTEFFLALAKKRGVALLGEHAGTNPGSRPTHRCTAQDAHAAETGAG